MSEMCKNRTGQEKSGSGKERRGKGIMRKWKCIETKKQNFTAGKIYEENQNGYLTNDFGIVDICFPINFANTKFEEFKGFTLADLKPCMVVVRRDGSVCGTFQLKDELKLQEDLNGVNCCTDNYNDDLTSKLSKKFDIMQVYNFSDNFFEISIEQRELLWERIEKSPRQLKLEELETKQREIADEMAKLRKEME
jgi:hypothetical protein